MHSGSNRPHRCTYCVHVVHCMHAEVYGKSYLREKSLVPDCNTLLIARKVKEKSEKVSKQNGEKKIVFSKVPKLLSKKLGIVDYAGSLPT